MRVRATVFVALVFAACAGQSSAAELAGSIEYTKSGGIAGIEESMKIDRNARGRIGAKRFTLPARDARALADAIRRADLTRVKSPKGSSCCDFFEYTISYRGHRVTWDENQEDQLPRRVRDLQERLAELYERYAPS
jgi:hypothetical protein